MSFQILKKRRNLSIWQQIILIEAEKRSVSQSVSRFGRKYISSYILKTYHSRPFLINPKESIIIRDMVEVEILCLKMYQSNFWWDEAPGYYNNMTSQSRSGQCSQWKGAARSSLQLLQNLVLSLTAALHCMPLLGVATPTFMVGKGQNPPLAWSVGKFHILCLAIIECFKDTTPAGLWEHYRKRTSFLEDRSLGGQSWTSYALPFSVTATMAISPIL